jgi:hypothetical protein
MISRSSRRSPDAQDLAAEIIRRAAAAQGQGPTYVVRLTAPPTWPERLQLMAARLQGTPVAIMPRPCKTVDEWIERYGGLKDG